MSSPAPQMRYVRRRSLAGPIVLITIGVIFLLGNMRVLTWPRLAHYFALYWPLLLILWGVVRLVEHWQDNRTGVPSRGIGAGGVLLIIFIIICGLAFTGAERVNWSSVQNEMDLDSDFSGLFGNSYPFTQTVEQPFAADTSLHVVSDRGDVTITPWEQANIKVVVNKKVVAGSEDDAKRIDRDTQPLLTTEGRQMTLNANTTGGGNHPVQSNLEIYLPRKAVVDVATRHGDVAVRGRTGDVKLSVTRGDATVQDVAGNVTIEMHRGSVRATDVQGDVSAEGRVDDTNITNVTGGVRLAGEYFGEMNLSKIGKMVTFKSARTDMQLARLDGDMTMQSGDFRAKSVAGPIRLLTRSKDIHLEDVSGDVRVENSNGAVEVNAAKLPLGTMEISNRRGDVQVVLPASAAFQLEASARRGDINSDFPSIKVDTTHDNSHAAGSVGSGGPRMQINNDNGNIDIRKQGSSNVTSLPGAGHHITVSQAYDGPGANAPMVAIASGPATSATPPFACRRLKLHRAVKIAPDSL